jgi:hypothetical protein
MTYQVRTNPFSGRNAASAKYDLIAALNTAAFADRSIPKDLAHRLTTAIVARLNWSRNELSIGHAQLAEMWSCDVRRVKRILADLKGRGLLVVKFSGVRGRVTVYSLCIERIVEISRPYWGRLGADFEKRLKELFPECGAEGSAQEESDAAEPDPTSLDAADGPLEPVSSCRRTIGDNGSCSSQQIPIDHQIKQSLERDVGSAAFSQWVRPLKFNTEGRRLAVVTGSPFVASYVERTYGDRIHEIVRCLLPDIENVRFMA